MNRERAETCVLKIADSFAPDEPLRTTFMSAVPVRRILREKLMNTTARKHLSKLQATLGRASKAKRDVLLQVPPKRPCEILGVDAR